MTSFKITFLILINYNALWSMKVALTLVAIIWLSKTFENSSFNFNGSAIVTTPPVLSAISPNKPSLQFVPSIVKIETETLFQWWKVYFVEYFLYE